MCFLVRLGFLQTWGRLTLWSFRTWVVVIVVFFCGHSAFKKFVYDTQPQRCVILKEFARTAQTKFNQPSDGLAPNEDKFNWICLSINFLGSRGLPFLWFWTCHVRQWESTKNVIQSERSDRDLPANSVWGDSLPTSMLERTWTSKSSRRPHTTLSNGNP